MRLRNNISLQSLSLYLLVVLGACFLSGPGIAGEKSYGISLFGQLKYKKGFAHFDYANPDAPKGGEIKLIGSAARNTFDSFNNFIRKGIPAQGLYLLYDTLLTRAMDEVDSYYGLLAETIELHDDKKGVTFTLRKGAKFSDGSQVKASDVVFSVKSLKEKGKPQYRLALQNIEIAEAISPFAVRFRFKGDQTRDLPFIIGTLPVLPAHFYQKHPFEQTSLIAPIGSGPYVLSTFKQGRNVVYTRRDNYWAKDLGVNKGRYNFEKITFEYFKDRSAEFEGLKAGIFDFREEFTSRDWATKYNFPAIKNGLMKLRTLKDENPSGAQGFFINLRREKFQNIHVRKALDSLFDFEWTNKNLFYSLYTRTTSFFENSPLKADGLPTKEELALLTPFKEQLPKAVFEAPYTPPVSNGSGQDRKLFRAASKMLKKAGYQLNRGKLVHQKTGQPLTIEFLTFSPSFLRIINPYVQNLKKLGIEASVRLVDSSQYQERLKNFDFDITTSRYTMSLTPGVNLKNFFGSSSANALGSFNLSGIKSPVVDKLIEHILAAKNYDELTIATRALDRVLRAGHYWVPQWYKAAHHIAFWDKFSWPKTKPKYARGVIDLWWYDEQKATALKAKQ